jgi:hypothetical protein
MRSTILSGGHSCEQASRFHVDSRFRPVDVGGAAQVTLGSLIDDCVLHMQHYLDQMLRRGTVTRYPRA